MNRTTTLIATGILLAAPLAVVAAAGPAHADVTKRGSCGAGTYEFQVDRDEGGWETGLDLDRVAPGSRWTLVVKHDGKRVARSTRTADREGDVELDVTRPDTVGRDAFRFKAKSASGTTCRGMITVG